VATRATGRTTSDRYFKLVREFPLTRIRDDAHLDRAEAVIHRMLEQDLDEGAQDYLDVLTDLVERYEDENVPIREASEADVLRLLMESNGLTQAQLSKEVGIAQSTISSVLNGTRSLTKGQVIALSGHFGVKPSAFLPGPQPPDGPRKRVGSRSITAPVRPVAGVQKRKKARGA
jgi:HTH-type transcriptional regulator/antitoxin HigA